MLDRLNGKRRTTQRSIQRSSILRGVYDQNRRLCDAGERGKPRTSAKRLRTLLVTLPVLVAAALFLFPPTLPTAALLADLPPSTWMAEPPVTAGAPAQPAAKATAREAAGTILRSMSPTPRLNRGSDNPIELSGLDAVVSDQQNIKNLFGLSVRTIVVDAGHGGRDPGALGKLGMHEKDITLDVARRLRDKLEASGAYRILMVRDEDVFVPLRERAAFANAQDVDLFVSIHVNYLPSVSTNAVETYYFGRYEDARTRELAEHENQGSDFSLSEFDGLMRKVQDTVKLQESSALAHAIQGSLLASIRAQNKRVLDNGVRTAPFVVLLGVKAPSVLVEIGSLSSPEAEQSLRREAYRDEIASYVAEGITHYLNEQPAQEYETHEDKNRLAERQ